MPVTALSGVLQPGQLVVLESTTYPGTTRERLRPILEESGLRVGFIELAGKVNQTQPAFCVELSELGLESVEPGGVLDLADVVAVLTAHPEVDYEDVVARAPAVVDFRGVTRGIEARNLVRL